MQRPPRSRGLFEPPSPDYPPSLLNAICCSIVPLLLIVWDQMFVVLGIAGFPSSWWNVLKLDLNLLGLVNQSRFITLFWTLLAFVRPTIPGDSPRALRTLFPWMAWFFFSDEATVTGDVVDGDSPESFFYVNGICTTLQMASDTGKELCQMLGRPVTVVHNPTDSALVDIAECILAKLWAGQSFVTSKPCDLLLENLQKALTNPAKKKVVLIAHSQGTIIAGDVLRRLQQRIEVGELEGDIVEKLEMYNLANASHWMKQTNGFPYIESICNQHDTVGKLGANAPNRVKQMWNIDIAGPLIYPTTSRWGHMVIAHYLKHLKNGDYPGSRLHEYLRDKAIAPEDIVNASTYS
eukprot:g3700.t1